jgi:hypothetical protein
MYLWIAVAVCLAGSTRPMEKLLEEGRYEDAIEQIQQALREKQGYNTLQRMKELLDDALFQRAEASGTPAAYEQYLADRPRGKHTSLARMRICQQVPSDDCASIDVRVAALSAGHAAENSGLALLSVDERAPTGVRSPDDAAIVIGLEDYAFIQDVPFAQRDAEAFGTWLQYSRGVPSERVEVLTHGSNEHIRAAVAKTGASAGEGGIVWVYFAGHGAASPTTRERLLLGDDVRPDEAGFESRGIEVKEVEHLAEASGARVMLILDTCFAGVGRDGSELLAGKRFAVPVYAASSTDRLAQWTATGPNQLSGPLPATRHGAFTYYVVGALRGWADGEIDGVPDGSVTAREAEAYVSRALREAGISDQQPVWNGTAALDWVLAPAVLEER